MDAQADCQYRKVLISGKMNGVEVVVKKADARTDSGSGSRHTGR